MPVTPFPLDQADPRVVGGRYRCGYWMKEYTVTAREIRHGVTWLTCQWADGRITTHTTAWDSLYDVIISQPATVTA